MARCCSSLVTAVLLISLAGCAAYQPNSSIESLEEQHQHALDDMRASALQPLRVWQQEAPPSCSSPNLAAAGDMVLTAARLLTPERSGVDAVIEGGGWILEVADAARQQGCKSAARHLYDAVIAIYVGEGYAALRQRAQIGIDDLRQ